jgi:hypothetical protein
MVTQIFNRSIQRYAHPKNWNKLGVNTKGFLSPLNEADRKIDENIDSLRGFIMNYIQERKTGKRESIFVEKVDILTMLLQEEKTFTDECIVDVLIDYFAASS